MPAWLLSRVSKGVRPLDIGLKEGFFREVVLAYFFGLLDPTPIKIADSGELKVKLQAWSLP
jgi:hypothetical protein